MRTFGLLRNRTLASGLVFAMVSTGCAMIHEWDPSPPDVSLEVSLDDWPFGPTRIYKVSSGQPDRNDTLRLADFERLHAVAVGHDNGGVFDVEVHAVVDRICDPSGPAEEKTRSRHDADEPKSAGDYAIRARMRTLDVEKPDDFPDCPSESDQHGPVLIRVWAVGTNFHGETRTSPSVTLLLQP
jgi:hypothetical protein